MLRSNFRPPEATVTPLLRRKLASEFTAARTAVVLTFKLL
jgi:hypothetical protein